MELLKEHQRQDDNDKLRIEFAKQANSFHAWMTETRNQMMEAAGSLEEQLDILKVSSCKHGFYLSVPKFHAFSEKSCRNTFSTWSIEEDRRPWCFVGGTLNFGQQVRPYVDLFLSMK